MKYIEFDPMPTSTVQLSLQIPDTEAGQRLDQALARLLPDYSRSRLKTWIEAGEVLVDFITGGIVKVKGTLVNIPVLFDVLSKIRGIEEYEIILTQTDPTDPFSEDVLLVKSACDKDRFPALSGEIRESVRRSQEVTPEVQWVPLDHYADTQMNYKFKRFKDERIRR